LAKQNLGAFILLPLSAVYIFHLFTYNRRVEVDCKLLDDLLKNIIVNFYTFLRLLKTFFPEKPCNYSLKRFRLTRSHIIIHENNNNSNFYYIIIKVWKQPFRLRYLKYGRNGKPRSSDIDSAKLFSERGGGYWSATSPTLLTSFGGREIKGDTETYKHNRMCKYNSGSSPVLFFDQSESSSWNATPTPPPHLV